MDRVAKLLVDAGDAPSFQAAAELLRTYRFQIVAGVEACHDVAWQAALLTAVNAGVRAMHGGVRVTLAADPPCLVPLSRGQRMSEALAGFGAEIATEPESDVPTIAFGGGSAPDGAVHVFAGRWVAGVSRTPSTTASAEVPAAVLAACLAVSEVFQRLRGHPVAADRDLTVSLWSPLDPCADGPPLTELPASAWLLGLGHLGQAYAWLLCLLPYPITAARRLVLQDDDRLSPANRGTSMLHRDERVGMHKTRLVAGVMDELGWDSQLVERRFAGGPIRQADDPAVLLAGVDNPLARRRLDEIGMPLVYDAGLGAGPDGFLGMTIRRLPGSRPSAEIWPADVPAERPPRRGAQAYADLIDETGDRCGVEQLAGRTVATAFVGVAAACWVLGGLLRELHGGMAFELVDVSLRDPAAVTAIAADGARPPRVSSVPRAR